MSRIRIHPTIKNRIRLQETPDFEPTLNPPQITFFINTSKNEIFIRYHNFGHDKLKINLYGYDRFFQNTGPDPTKTPGSEQNTRIRIGPKHPDPKPAFNEI